MMNKLKNSHGLTLVELLVTVVIAFTVLGLVSSVLVQSFRNMEMVDTNINLRQEANILVAMINSSHISSININDTRTYSYTINYKRIIDTNDWELTIGNQIISKQNYYISLELQQTIPGENIPRRYMIDSSTLTSDPFNIVKRQALYVKKLKLIDKKDSTKTFEISTTISRL
jgi:type II secretory pathway pseudopilin PulG